MRPDLLPHTFEGGLIKLVQKCSEVTKAVTKIQLFGEIAIDSITGVHYNNVRDLLAELNDLEHSAACIRRALAKRGFVVSAPDIPITDFHPDLPDMT